MKPNPPPDPIRSIFEVLQWCFDSIIELIRFGKWSKLLLLIDAILVLLFMPDIGVFYESLSKIFPPKQYPIFFGVAVFLVFSAALVLRLLNLDRPITGRWGRCLLWIVAIIALILVIYSIFPRLDVRPTTLYSEGDRFSWGEEFLIPEEPKCKTNKDTGTGAYKRHGYKDAETDYRSYVKECKDATEAQIYLNNARAMQTKNPMKLAISVPIDRKNGAYDSREILRGVAIAQDEWNKKNEDKKLLIGIADDGYGKGNNECGKNRDRGECQKARETAERLVEQNDILGVIGHFSSDATEAASKTYEEGKLVAISPTSTAVRKNSQCSEDAICLNSYIFRTAPNDSIVVKKLIENLPSKVKKVAIVYEGRSIYSRLFKEKFTEEFQEQQDSDAIVNPQSDNNYCNFSRTRAFNPKNCLKEAETKGADALLLIPSDKNASNLKAILDENYRSQSRLDLLGSDSMYKEQFIIGENQESTEGMLIVVPWHRSDYPCEEDSNRLECKAARLVGGSEAQASSSQQSKPLEISWRTATAYDATQVLIKGLKQTSDQKCSFRVLGLSVFDYGTRCLRRELKDVLLSIEAEGTLGSEKVKFFDSQGDRSDEEEIGVVVVVQGGQFRRKL